MLLVAGPSPLDEESVSGSIEPAFMQCLPDASISFIWGRSNRLQSIHDNVDIISMNGCHAAT